jgi:pilus assembly protein Flp/PilA
MKTIHGWLRNFLRQQQGATAIEYGLIAAGISLAIATAVMTFGGGLSETYDYIASRMAEAVQRGLGG